MDFLQLDLPLIWAVLIAVAIMLYVLLDGMDLGIGMLTFAASDEDERNMMTAAAVCLRLSRWPIPS